VVIRNIQARISTPRFPRTTLSPAGRAAGERPVDGVALSRRQQEVLDLLAEGLSARAISAKLGIAETTTRNHIQGLLRRLDCHSQLQAVARARRERLL
jgi:DNA-binding NarL/FixJ family response regulator